MEYTEHLNLPVLEDGDTMTSVFSQANAIATQLENLFGDNLDDYQSLSDITTDIAGLKNDMLDVQGDITDLENEDTSLGNRITALNTLVTQIQSGRNVYTDADGNIVNGTITKYVLTAESIGYVNSYPLDNRYLHVDNGALEINLTEAIGLIHTANAVLLSAEIYENRNSSSINNPLALHSFGNKIGFFGKYIIFRAKNTYVGATENPDPIYEGKSHTIVLTIFVEDVE